MISFSAELKPHSLSLSDSVGILYASKEKIVRVINPQKVLEVKEIFDSGLIENLVQNNLFVNSWISVSDLTNKRMEVEHEKISPVFLPTEWTFEMLKDVALCALEINKVAEAYGYELKDCHAHNFLFSNGKCKMVDLGSLVKKGTGDWGAYREFLAGFYHPLKIWRSHGGQFTKKFLQEGPLITFYIILKLRYPFIPYSREKMITKIYNLYFYIQSNSAQVIQSRIAKRIKFKVPLLFLKILKSLVRVPSNQVLKDRILRLNRTNEQTIWSNYHSGYFNEALDKSDHRFSSIIQILKNLKISSVLELAGNMGFLSQKILSETCISKVICTDYDENAVEKLYQMSKLKDFKMDVGLVDFMNSYDPENPYSFQSRCKSDAVIALAVTHHLILTQNYNLSAIFNNLKSCTNRYILIEFMPLGLWDGKMAPPLPAWYTQEWFESELQKYFNVLKVENLAPNRVLYVGEILHHQNKGLL